MALQDFNQVVILEAENASAYNNHGFVKRDLRRTEEALIDIGEAIRLDPKLAIAYYNRALAYGQLEQYSDALEDLEMAAERGFDPEALEEAVLRFSRGQ